MLKDPNFGMGSSATKKLRATTSDCIVRFVGCFVGLSEALQLYSLLVVDVPRRFASMTAIWRHMVLV